MHCRVSRISLYYIRVFLFFNSKIFFIDSRFYFIHKVKEKYEEVLFYFLLSSTFSFFSFTKKNTKKIHTIPMEKTLFGKSLALLYIENQYLYNFCISLFSSNLLFFLLYYYGNFH